MQGEGGSLRYDSDFMEDVFQSKIGRANCKIEVLLWQSFVTVYVMKEN